MSQSRMKEHFERDGKCDTEKIVTIRIKDQLLEALERYCEDNFADQSSVIRTALAQWPPIAKILEEIKKGEPSS